MRQLEKGYDEFVKYSRRKTSKMEIARVKNGFTNETVSGYRDIKINVIFSAESGKKMICELQLILGQQLVEKKRSHKLYSVTREREYYSMVTQPQNEKGKELDLKALTFQPVLNVKEEVETQYYNFTKCAMNSEMDLLFMKPYSKSEILCVNKSDRKVVFQSPAYKDGHHSHHWVTLNKRHYLSVQSAKNVVKFFFVKENGKQFAENESLKITLPDSDSITYVEFDKKFENVFLVKNGDE